MGIITSNYYSIIYYNAEVWLLPSINPQLKQKLLSASASPLKRTMTNYNYLVLFKTLHYINQRATPHQIKTYKHTLLLHKLYNDDIMSRDWVDLFFSQHFNQRDQKIRFFNTSNYKVGNNILANRFTTLNGKIELSWLNDTFTSYKIKCKSKFLN